MCVCEEKARSPRHSSNRFLLLFLLSFFLAPSAPRAIVAAVDGGGSPGSGTVWRHCQPNPSLFFSFFFFPLYILADSLEPPFTHTHSPFFLFFKTKVLGPFLGSKSGRGVIFSPCFFKLIPPVCKCLPDTPVLFY